ncbi:FAD/FMN-containing dehydrogenase [Novosphingobium sp. CF614]|uniref:FAD-binding oxidoreductase n=1 Tax=Novosphingobium sp. CF614 TaxID=1884364 RepID=UPI0008EB6D8B|nr:FAD-binding oxidoreductase [Novosphingobium sp. CF614]SFG52632.1 FAD/FMN-containing dehydrogenase [Novosphingobium sp. CF614]
MSARDGLIARLTGIVGEANVLIDAGDVAGYRTDGRGEGDGVPLAVVRPVDADAVSALIHLAAERGVRIVVQGARTGLAGAGLASEDGGCLIVNLDRLSRHIAIDPENRTATVDAGVRLSALNAAAAEHGLFFPIDLGADPAIGGMIAANTGGSRLLRYGDVRSNLLSLDFVRADAEGASMTLGAPLWKNNTGLDLKQLLVGSAGSMGIVTRATLALQPLPRHRITAMIALREPAFALPLLLALERDFGTLLSAFEGMSGPAYAAALEHVPGLRSPFANIPNYVVLVELSAGAVLDEALLEEWLAVDLEPYMDGDGAPVIDVAIDHRDGLWAIRHAVPEGLRASGTVIACDIALRRGDMMRFRDDMAGRLKAEAPMLVPHDFGHIGDGGLHYNLVWPSAAGPVDRTVVERTRSLIFDAVVREYGGSFSAEHGIGPRNIAHYPRFVPAPVRQLAGALQQLVAPVPLGRVDFGMME